MDVFMVVVFERWSRMNSCEFPPTALPLYCLLAQLTDSLLCSVNAIIYYRQWYLHVSMKVPSFFGVIICVCMCTYFAIYVHILCGGIIKWLFVDNLAF